MAAPHAAVRAGASGALLCSSPGADVARPLAWQAGGKACAVRCPAHAAAPFRAAPLAASSPVGLGGGGGGARAATRAAALPPKAADEEAAAEAARLATAAAILCASDAGSDGALAEGVVEGGGAAADAGPLAALDDLQVLDGDALSLVVGILRQHQPLDADEADVQLSERLRDLLMLLRRRPSGPVGGSDAGTGAQPAAAHGDGSGDDGGFWAGPDEWADVRAALMGIGINASVDEEDEEEDVWAIEEEGPARRTRLLKRLPRLDAATAAELARFLADVEARSAGQRLEKQRRQQQQQHTGAHGGGGQPGATAAADVQQQQQQLSESSEDEQLWWSQVTDAYQRLWQQARLQRGQAE